jgi:hypothetical protein
LLFWRDYYNHLIAIFHFRERASHMMAVENQLGFLRLSFKQEDADDVATDIVDTKVGWMSWFEQVGQMCCKETPHLVQLGAWLDQDDQVELSLKDEDEQTHQEVAGCVAIGVGTTRFAFLQRMSGCFDAPWLRGSLMLVAIGLTLVCTCSRRLSSSIKVKKGWNPDMMPRPE